LPAGTTSGSGCTSRPDAISAENRNGAPSAMPMPSIAASTATRVESNTAARLRGWRTGMPAAASHTPHSS
jgi:hypothetical protein